MSFSRIAWFHLQIDYIAKIMSHDSITGGYWENVSKNRTTLVLTYWLLTWIEAIEAFAGEFVFDEADQFFVNFAAVETAPVSPDTAAAAAVAASRKAASTPKTLTIPLAAKLAATGAAAPAVATVAATATNTEDVMEAMLIAASSGPTFTHQTSLVLLKIDK